MWLRTITITTALLLLLTTVNTANAKLQPMADSELSNITGQALFVADKISETQTLSDGSDVDYTFYKGGLDAKLDLNLNVKELELGRTDTGVDLHAENIAFGCTSDGNGNCVDSGSATGLKPFSLLRPYLQFAIKNDDTATLREVVGLRLGAENVTGPLSIGKFKSFSGFLNATADITMQGQFDVAPTCDNANAPCTGTAQQQEADCLLCIWIPRTPTDDGSTYYEENPGSDTNNCDPNCTTTFSQPETALGVDDDHECVLNDCVAFSQLTVSYDTQERLGLPVTLSGMRKTQAIISDLLLASLVDDIVATMEVIRPDGLSGGLISAVLPLLQDSVAEKFKNQLATGLGVTDDNGNGIDDELDAYELPYNISNLHQVDINSANFGLSFQSQEVKYPGFQDFMDTGWTMHLPDAFNLVISDKTSVFVNNIVSSSAARDGNIIGLPPVYDNCFGSAQFC